MTRLANRKLRPRLRAETALPIAFLSIQVSQEQ